MTPVRRVFAIYRKELLEILRDRRTLLAMIVVPVVLYPVLLLGFFWGTQFEERQLRAETFVVEVADDAARQQLDAILAHVRDQESNANETAASFDVRVAGKETYALGDHVQLRVLLELEPGLSPELPRFKITIQYNEVNVHSRTAMDELTQRLRRITEIRTRDIVADALAGAGHTRPTQTQLDLIFQPVRIETVTTATERERGGWALGVVVPVILVLMTITGGVYPAIDLTAGERERGTLETVMATPVPPLYLILGKFLVVATISLFAAVLNVASVGGTMHFGGISQVISHEMPIQFPITAPLVILLCMIPFALLFAAVLVAVCSFARTFKEAQNYVMPVIIAAMIPCFAVSLESVRLQGILMVLPVANMVLLTRLVFFGTYTAVQVVIVLSSTTLYAVAAIALAARLFGQEAVLFPDAGSYRTLLQRRYFHPTPRPTTAQALLLAALLFPASFYAQTLLARASGDDFIRTLIGLAGVQFAGLYALLPLGVALYFKSDPVETFRLRPPRPRAWLAALMIGASSWAVAHLFIQLQMKVLKPSQQLIESFQQIETQIAEAPLGLTLLLLALVPALAEEFFFRGFVLGGLSDGLKKWSAILLSAAIFGVYHFLIDKVVITALLGVMLAYLCWQTRSIFPGMLVHALHNGLVPILSRLPAAARWLGLDAETADAALSLPIHVTIPAVIFFAAGLLLIAGPFGRRSDPETEPRP